MKLNGRVHYNVEMRFNANSLAVMFTAQNAIGVNKLPNVVFENRIYDSAWTYGAIQRLVCFVIGIKAESNNKAEGS